MLANGSKMLLKNTIRHTTSHNRSVEEDEMWRHVRQTDRSSHVKRKRNHGSTKRHLSAEEVRASNKRKKFYTRLIEDIEELDADRWGHAGYKELYPDEFQSSTDSDSEDERDKKKTKRDQFYSGFRQSQENNFSAGEPSRHTFSKKEKFRSHSNSDSERNSTHWRRGRGCSRHIERDNKETSKQGLSSAEKNYSLIFSDGERERATSSKRKKHKKDKNRGVDRRQDDSSLVSQVEAESESRGTSEMTDTSKIHQHRKNKKERKSKKDKKKKKRKSTDVEGEVWVEKRS